MKKIIDLLDKQILFFDGGTGTVLQSIGLKPGELPETWNILHPEKITELHFKYFEAGANIIKTNTFGAFITKFPLNLEKIINSAIQNAINAKKKSGKKNQFIAFDISSTGKLLKPMGDLDFEDCINLYKKTFSIAFKNHIDCVLIETMNDGYETKAAVIAAKETMELLNVDFPIFVTNVYDKECRTLSGSSPESMVSMLEGLGVNAIGVNCSLGPKEMINCVKRLCACASVPVIVNPNAGLPKVINNHTIFDIKEQEFVKEMKKIYDEGATILGGCCGTTPDYINLLQKTILKYSKKDKIEEKLYSKKINACKCVISSNSKVVYFGNDNKPVLIGERINPTGKKKFKEALKNNDIPYIIQQGLEQENAGANVLDVNVGLPDIDEEEMMLKVITELQSVSELPLQIDTSSASVMEKALRRYNGKPLVNSVNGKKEIMSQIFPLVKKYGGVIIGLTLDESGIPEKSAQRIEIAKKIYKEGLKYGITKNNIIIDPLAMAVSSDSKAGLATLETVEAIHCMGGNTSLGISNVSFGLPNREFITSAFFTMALSKGLSAAIMNPLQFEMKKAFYTFCLLDGKDNQCTQYLSWCESVQNQINNQNQYLEKVNKSENQQIIQTNSSDIFSCPDTLEYAVVHGLREDSSLITKQLLKTNDSLSIINNHLIPGLDYVGKKFENKTMYLPQLLMAAEAAKSAFSEIKAFLEKSGKKGESKGKIILATVKGDIHDIGKNIVKVLLENYDFEVIDLGKDVAPEIIMERCKKDNVRLVGLSALMTTTVGAMEETIKLLKKECPWAKTCVGGAVMTQEYATQIGADNYAKDAMDTVRFAIQLFSDNN